MTDDLDHTHASQLAEAAENAVHHASHAAHELPSFISLLHEHSPKIPFFSFLHQWENVVFSFFIALCISAFVIRATSIKGLVPENGSQNLFEAIVEIFEDFVTGIIGEHGSKHVPFLGTLFFYILFMNWIGLIPLMKSPTSVWSTTAAIALITMVYVQIAGIREQGFWHYLKHMAGSPTNILGILLIPLMLSLNLILEILAVPFSLSLRLFANISSEDRLLYNFAIMIKNSYIAFPLQLFVNCLAIIFSLVQAFVFTLLSTVYIALISPRHENHHEHDEEHLASSEVDIPHVHS